MSLRSELKEAMAVALEKQRYLVNADRVREERWGGGGTLVAAQAVLSVCDEYEEVEVQEACSKDLWRTRERNTWEPHIPSFTVYRKKQKPEPDVTELARRAVKAWRETHNASEPVCDAMDALEKKLDE